MASLREDHMEKLGWMTWRLPHQRFRLADWFQVLILGVAFEPPVELE